MRILFVRHGEPDYARDCLTAQGRLQARAAALRLREEGTDVLFSSPMGRAVETAEALSAQLDRKPVTLLPFMHELRWGSADGAPVFADGHPWDIADEMIRQGMDLTDPSWAELPWFKNNLVTAGAQTVARETDEWLATLGYVREGRYYRHAGDGPGTAAVFCHGGSSSAAAAHLLNLTFPYVCALLHLPFAGMFSLRFDPRPGSLCLPHLEQVTL